MMEMHPVNLGARFLLELAALLSLGVWGWKQSDDWVKFILAIGVPVMAALVWGLFNVPNDPSRGGGAPVIVPGVVRLVIEIGIFMAAVWALYDIGYTNPSLLFVAAVAVHYIASYQRILWLFAH